MLSQLLGLVRGAASPYLAYAAGAIGLVAVTTIGVLWLQVSNANEKIAALQVDKAALQSAVDAKQLVIDGKSDVIKELLDAHKKLDANRRRTIESLTETRNAKPSDNGNVAPVLDRALSRTDPGGVRPPRANPNDAIRHRRDPARTP